MALGLPRTSQLLPELNALAHLLYYGFTLLGSKRHGAPPQTLGQVGEFALFFQFMLKIVPAHPPHLSPRNIVALCLTVEREQGDFLQKIGKCLP